LNQRIRERLRLGPEALGEDTTAGYVSFEGDLAVSDSHPDVSWANLQYEREQEQLKQQHAAAEIERKRRAAFNEMDKILTSGNTKNANGDGNASLSSRPMTLEEETKLAIELRGKLERERQERIHRANIENQRRRQLELQLREKERQITEQKKKEQQLKAERRREREDAKLASENARTVMARPAIEALIRPIMINKLPSQWNDHGHSEYVQSIVSKATMKVMDDWTSKPRTELLASWFHHDKRYRGIQLLIDKYIERYPIPPQPPSIIAPAPSMPTTISTSIATATPSPLRSTPVTSSSSSSLTRAPIVSPNRQDSLLRASQTSFTSLASPSSSSSSSSTRGMSGIRKRGRPPSSSPFSSSSSSTTSSLALSSPIVNNNNNTSSIGSLTDRPLTPSSLSSLTQRSSLIAV
jgi:hypothetical protein